MASSNYNYDKNNPFFSEEVDDATFLKGGRRGIETSSVEDRHKQLLEERKRVEERTIQSSFRSLTLLNESEEIGTATAEELNRQREQLKNTEQKLDEINANLRISQRHITGIKSVFGSIRNYFTAPKNDGKKVIGLSSSSSGELGGSGSTKEESKDKLAQILEAKDVTTRKNDIHHTERFRTEAPLSSKDVDSILDKNLEEMSFGLSRLKNLGLDLNREIVDQNSMVDRITIKAENVEHKVQSQTKDMNRILNK